MPNISDELMDRLEAMSREPFREALADFLGASPSKEDIEEWAKTRPDRWAQGLSIVARLSGYTDKLEIEGNVHHLVHQLSDSDLKQRLEQLRSEEPIEGEFTEVDDDIPPEETP